jgi:ACR3 family arsenite efflux pump ArsB
VYCLGSTEATRAMRSVEIESDLWEQFADGRAAGVSPAVISLETLSRVLRGVPNDIAWRFQVEAFHMNIQFPVERLAGVLILFLIIPFIAGTTISGYDTSQDGWASEFARFSDIPARNRDLTALAHAAIGLLLIGAVSQAFVTLRERSPKLVTLGSALLLTAGVIMLVNAAAYRAMSGVANDYLATGDSSLLVTGRAFAHVVESLAAANLFATVAGILAFAVALVRLRMVPRWTVALPTFGVSAPFLWVPLDAALGDVGWLVMSLGLLSVTAWLLICGVWLLFGGSKTADSRASAPLQAS